LIPSSAATNAANAANEAKDANDANDANDAYLPFSLDTDMSKHVVRALALPLAPPPMK
jgi:hypothetical protein